MGAIQNIPLFPLGLVLFPKQYLPLHIFEERYKLMVGECLRDQSSFGVVLIREGVEAGGPAIPFEVGTTARILDIQPLIEGRMNLKTMGDRPFRIATITQHVPYMRADVEFLEHRLGTSLGVEPVVESVRKQFTSHLDILSSLSNRETVHLDMDLDPESLSYLVASVMAVEMQEKQELLEIAEAGERLAKEASILARENRTLQTFLYLRDRGKNNPPSQGETRERFSPN